MSAVLCYSTQAAAPHTAAWVSRVLGPVIKACRFDSPPPVELRPTGRAAGYCQPGFVAPDGRVAISKLVCFWSDSDFVDVFLHESAHRLLAGREVLDHGPEFFVLNLSLLLRAQAFFERDVVELMGLYDLQDQPAEVDEPNWRGVILGWALPVAAELEASGSSAEQLADVVCDRWKLFVRERENARAQAVQQILAARKKAAAVEGKIEDLKSSIFVWRALSSVGFLFFLSVCIFVF